MERVTDAADQVWDAHRDVFRDLPVEISFERGGALPPVRMVPLCAICKVHTERVFEADSDTHHVVNRSGNPVGCYLCCHCWGLTLKEGAA